MYLFLPQKEWSAPHQRNQKLQLSVHVEDIDLDENVEIPHEVNFTIITIVAPTVEEEEIEEEDEFMEEGEAEAAPADEETSEE